MKSWYLFKTLFLDQINFIFHLTRTKTIWQKICTLGCQSFFWYSVFSSKTANYHLWEDSYSVPPVLPSVSHPNHLLKHFFHWRIDPCFPVYSAESSFNKKNGFLAGNKLPWLTPFAGGVWNLPNKFHLYLISLFAVKFYIVYPSLTVLARIFLANIFLQQKTVFF